MVHLIGIANFFLYLAIALAAGSVFVFLYTRFTEHNEIELIRQDNPAAAVAFGGSLIGFGIAMSGVLSNVGSIFEMFLWSVMALIVQMLAFALVRIGLPKISSRITEGQMAPAIWLASVSITAGLLNGAAMTY